MSTENYSLRKGLWGRLFGLPVVQEILEGVAIAVATATFVSVSVGLIYWYGVLLFTVAR